VSRKLQKLDCTWTTLLVTLVALASSSGNLCADDFGSLRIEPAKAQLFGASATQRFLVLATDQFGLTRDVTSRTSLRVFDTRVAKIDARGQLSALADGDTTLEAIWEGQTTTAKISIEQSSLKRTVNFARDVVGVLTKAGCNASECHGGVKGRGGLKLSMNGLNVREDYRWIVEGGVYQVLVPEPAEPIKPRVDVADPTESLLLLKPTLTEPHDGGERLVLDSPDYKKVLDWIKAGAPQDEPGSVTSVERLDLFPKDPVLERGGKHRLLVTARLEDGRSEDVSTEVRYESTNPDVVTVDGEGQLQAHKTGEVIVFAHAPGRSTQARVGVIEAPTRAYPEVPTRNLIDELIVAKLRHLHLVPSDLSSDEEFLRRVCLDLTGTLPPPERVPEFIADPDPQKREKLIDALLDSPEYVDYWTFRFSDFFQVTYRNARTYKLWIRESIALNKPYDQMAREHVGAQGNTAPTRNFFKANGGMMSPGQKMSADARLFLGVRLDCAECHDHPFESWTQSQFWGLAAFYGPTTRTLEGALFFEHATGRGARVMHPRLKTKVEPRFVGGETIGDKANTAPRRRFAEWMTKPGNPFFARSIVNRVWSYFFGHGFVDPVDDFKDTNPPTHPELLDALARDFEEHGYDLKHLMRRITQSRTYQTSGTANATNGNDKINFSRSLPRRLDAEVLLDAITSVTRVNELFTIHEYVGGGSEPRGTRAIELVAEVTPSQFLDVFGRPPFREAVPVRDYRVTLKQALHTLVGSAFNEKIAREDGRLDRLLKRNVDNSELITEFYLAALTRFPRPDELADLQALLNEASDRRKAIEHLVWALIASREFTYNH